MKNKSELPVLPDLASRLVWARLRMDLTQRGLAEMTDVEQTTIAKIENGITKNPRKIEIIALALNVPPAWLRFGIEDLDKLSEESVSIALEIQSKTPEQRAAILQLLQSLK